MDPSQLWRLTLEDPVCRFRLDGYYTLLVGQKVPHRRLGGISSREKQVWNKLREATRRFASEGVGVREALKIVQKPEWRWQPKHYAA